MKHLDCEDVVFVPNSIFATEILRNINILHHKHSIHNTVLLIQVIAMKDFTLPIMILTQSNLTVQPPSTQDTSDTVAQVSTNTSKSTKCQLAFCDGICYLHDIEHLFEPFIMVLKDCNKPTALYNLLLPVIDR